MKSLNFVKNTIIAFLLVGLFASQGFAQYSEFDDMCKTCKKLKQQQQHADYAEMGCAILEYYCDIIEPQGIGGTGPIVMGGSRNDAQGPSHDKPYVLKAGQETHVLCPIRNLAIYKKGLHLEVKIVDKKNKAIYSSTTANQRMGRCRVFYLDRASAKQVKKKVRAVKNVSLVKFRKNEFKAYVLIPVKVGLNAVEGKGKIIIKGFDNALKSKNRKLSFQKEASIMVKRKGKKFKNNVKKKPLRRVKN